MTKRTSGAAYFNSKFGALSASSLAFAFAPLTGLSGTLENGIIWSIDNTTNQPIIFSNTGNGDIRTEGGGFMIVNFSAPVDVEHAPLTDPALLSPTNWSYQNAPGIFPDRATTNGDQPVYVAGSVAADVSISPDSVDANPTAGNGIAAVSDWGKMTFPNTTQVAMRQRNNSAMNWRVRPL